MLAGVVQGDIATFFGIRFGGATLTFGEILGEEVMSRPADAGLFAIEHLAVLIQSTLSATSF